MRGKSRQSPFDRFHAERDSGMFVTCRADEIRLFEDLPGIGRVVGIRTGRHQLLVKVSAPGVRFKDYRFRPATQVTRYGR